MKRFLQIFLFVIVLLNIIILVTGSTYVYKSLYYNFANIDDYRIFHNRVVPAKNPQPWPVSTDYNKVKFAASFEDLNMELGSVAYLIVRNDSILSEHYWDDYSDTSHSGSFSMAKSIVSTLIDIAIKDGKISSIDDAVGKYIPEFNSDEKKNITIHHLLEMSSGLEWNESYTNPISITTEAYYGSDLYDLVTALPVETTPGKVFNYQSCNTQILGIVLEKATGRKLSEYVSEKLWTPIGAEHDALWSTDKKDGLEKAFCCFNSNARDFARLGKLYLHKGNWNGVQIVDTAFVEESTKPNPLKLDDGTPNKKYGLHWWCINSGGHDVFYARGHLGQYIFVVPDKEMIVVRLGAKRGTAMPDGHTTDVHSFLDEALKMYP